MLFLALSKWILVLGCLVAGVGLLLTGAGVDIPLIKYKGLEAYGVPAGVVVLIVGVALARFWSIRRVEKFPDGREVRVVYRLDH